MKAAFVIFLLMLVGASWQLGVLWTDQISGNLVNGNGWVRVEETIIDDNTMRTDYIDEIEEDDDDWGVSVEESIWDEGSGYVPVDLTVDEVATVWGLLNANGGILADRGDLGGYSFKVEDNTGDTYVEGTLFPNGGINADNGKFTVEDETGETRIADALLRPDGGINANNGKFVVDASTGDVKTEGHLTVREDIELGTTLPETRRITRVPSSEDDGGNTHIQGQSATLNGGDLVLEPGCGNNGCGEILFGRAQADNLFIGRAETVGNGVTGGTTTIQGQTSPAGNGGDLILRAGDSTTNAAAGDIILDPGHSDGAGSPGVIYLGTDNPGEVQNFDLLVTRPDVTNVDGGATTLHGQDAISGNGGDLTLSAGSTSGAAAAGGDLVLLPGTNGSGAMGDIVLGRADNDEINVTRYTVEGDGGATSFVGQTSTNSVGGDVIIQSGDGGAGQDGGNIYLTTGVSGAGAATHGEIVWGNADDPLVVSRPTTAGSSSATTIQGQRSIGGVGGDLVLEAGSGATSGGDVLISGGTGATRGDVVIAAGSGSTAGVVEIAAGNGAGGGNVEIASTAGNVVLEAGSSEGQVIVRNSNSFQVNGITSILNGRVRVQAGTCQDRSVGDTGCQEVTTLFLEADPTRLVSYKDNNGDRITLLRSRQTLQVPILFQDPDAVVPADATDVIAHVEDIRTGFYALLNVLGPCGHGLFSYTDDQGNVFDAVANGSCDLGTPGPLARRGLNSGFNYSPSADTDSIYFIDADVLTTV